MAISGSSDGSTSTSFSAWALTTEKLVTSEPVPLVVGMATNCGRWRAASGRVCARVKITALAASITEPPPSATTRSGAQLSICFIPRTTVAISGSATTSSQICTSTPRARRIVVTRSARPNLTIAWSVTSRARWAFTSVRTASASWPKQIRGFSKNSLIGLFTPQASRKTFSTMATTDIAL